MIRSLVLSICAISVVAHAIPSFPILLYNQANATLEQTNATLSKDTECVHASKIPRRNWTSDAYMIFSFPPAPPPDPLTYNFPNLDYSIVFQGYSTRKSFDSKGVDDCVKFLIQYAINDIGGSSNLNDVINSEMEEEATRRGMKLKYEVFDSEGKLTWGDLIASMRKVRAFALWYEDQGYAFSFRVIQSGHEPGDRGEVVISGKLSGTRSRDVAPVATQ